MRECKSVSFLMAVKKRKNSSYINKLQCSEINNIKIPYDYNTFQLRKIS